jgi:hypothetical protein
MSNLGEAQLIATLVTKTLESDLRNMEKTVSASFAKMATSAQGIIPKGIFSAGTGEAKALESALAGIATGATKTTRATDPLASSIRGLANELNDYKVRLEAGEVEQRDFVAGMQGVITRSKELRDTVDQTSTQYGRLTNIIGTSTRSVTTAEGRISALGLSQQVALGHTNHLRDSVAGLGTGFLTLGSTLPGVIGVAGLGGLATVAGRLATEANAANVATDILALTVDRVGVSSSAVRESISNTAESLGVAEGQVVDYATQLLRIGVAADQIDDVLVAGGASALAFGKSAAQGIDSVTNALVTGNSTNLQTIGISQNVGAAMNEAAEGAANLGKEASQQAAASAGLNIILEATSDEVGALDKLTGGLTGAQNEAATAAYEAKYVPVKL